MCRLRKLCAKIEEIDPCGTILCHNRRFARKWHRVFIPERGRHLNHQVQACAAFGSSVPKSRKSIPVAQFCAKIGVLSENGTEISFRGARARLGHQVQAGDVLAGSVPKSRKSLPVAQFCTIIGVLPENGTEFSFRGEGGALVIRFKRALSPQALGSLKTYGWSTA